MPKPKGGVFGVHAGYNWQWAQQGVVGIEVDYSGAHINQTQATTIHFDGEQVGNIFIPGEDDTRTLKAKLDHLASARARVGVLVSPNVLLYGTGGAAWGHVKFTDTFQIHTELGDNTSLVSRASSSRFGWVAGAGAEWKLWGSGLMLRVEYLHYDLGSASLAFDATLDSGLKKEPFNMHLEKLTTDVVRGGVSYKF